MLRDTRCFNSPWLKSRALPRRKVRKFVRVSTHAVLEREQDKSTNKQTNKQTNKKEETKNGCWRSNPVSS